uniref:Uncharacterized protein n=1 Tax=Siphoviridae sp. ctRCE13 TaxID=2826332 RepID=A0A8S5QPG7_9CAUD|nr:MAG TPA: hypothetical protein [Siphoviridae sp. ctRCE13]
MFLCKIYIINLYFRHFSTFYRTFLTCPLCLILRIHLVV